MQIEQKKETQQNIVSISKGIIYGNIAFSLGKKADKESTHKWICYLRGHNNEDISYFVSKVTFTLHSTFENSVRVISSPPFEIHEVGWGEFEINISVSFIDTNYQDIDIVHLIKLHPNQSSHSTTAKKPVISEFYDEIVFVNPSPQFQKILQSHQENQNLIDQYQIKYEEIQFNEDEMSMEKNYLQYLQNIDINSHTRLLEDAIYYINHELKDYNQKLLQIDQQIQRMN